LNEAIDHEIYYRGFSTGQSVNITAQQRRALLAFLQSLSDPP
jgi:cytochrome c peroxidase